MTGDVQSPGATGFVDRWRGFWFRPQPAYSLGLVRMAFGALVVAWALTLIPDLYDFFGSEGVAAEPTSTDWNLFALWSSNTHLLIGWWVLLAAAVMLAVGWHSRVAALLVFVLIVSFERRTFFVFNGGDGLIRIEALLLMLSSCGAALSLDRRRAGESFWSSELRAPWALRLLQVQLSLIYLTSVVMKMTGDSWPQGTAVSYALRLEDMLIVATPQWISADALLMNLATWATLALEVAIGVLVWNKRLRPWVLAAGVVMHTSIMLTLNVGFFTFAMFVLYLAFVPAERVQQFPDQIRRIVSARRRHDGRDDRDDSVGALPVKDDSAPTESDTGR